jgi:hypothetical protein
MADPDSLATPAEDIRQAFAHVVVPCGLDPDLYDVLIEGYIYALQTGSPKLPSLSLMMLSESEWDWKWFDQWLTDFEEADQWPYMWRHDESNFPYIKSKNATRKFRFAKVHILAHTISHISVNVRRFRNTQEFKRDRVLRLSPSIGCPVEDAVAVDFQSSMTLEDWRTWPPFFPGDRSNAAPFDRRHLERFSKGT